MISNVGWHSGAYLKNSNRFTVARLDLDRFTANFPKIKINGGDRDLDKFRLATHIPDQPF